MNLDHPHVVFQCLGMTLAVSVGAGSLIWRKFIRKIKREPMVTNGVKCGPYKWLKIYGYLRLSSLYFIVATKTLLIFGFWGPCWWWSSCWARFIDPRAGWALPREQPTCRCLENAHSTDGAMDESDGNRFVIGKMVVPLGWRTAVYMHVCIPN